jgi:hypothetical protein
MTQKAPKTKQVEVKRIEWFDDRCYRIRYENDQKVDVEEYLPSITTILNVSPKPFLLKWYADLGYREARLRMFESAERGSRIHWAWETAVSGGVVIYNPIKAPLYDNEEIEELKKKFNQHYFMLHNQDEMWDFMKLEKFYKAINPKFKLCEETIFNLDSKMAGTMDNIFHIAEGEYQISGAKPVKLEEGLYLFDVKTGNTISDEAKLQLSAYWNLVDYMRRNKFIELPDVEIKGAIIGHTSAQTKTGIEGFSAIVINKEQQQKYYSRFQNLYAVWIDTNPNFAPKQRQLKGYITL